MRASFDGGMMRESLGGTPLSPKHAIDDQACNPPHLPSSFLMTTLIAFILYNGSRQIKLHRTTGTVLFLDNGQYTVAQILSGPYAFSIHCVDAAPCDNFHLVHGVNCEEMA
jgi:hypothetical protein